MTSLTLSVWLSIDQSIHPSTHNIRLCTRLSIAIVSDLNMNKKIKKILVGYLYNLSRSRGNWPESSGPMSALWRCIAYGGTQAVLDNVSTRRPRRFGLTSPDRCDGQRRVMLTCLSQGLTPLLAHLLISQVLFPDRSWWRFIEQGG